MMKKIGILLVTLGLLFSCGGVKLEDPPKNVKLVAGDGFVTVSWDSVDGATVYDVSYSENSDLSDSVKKEGVTSPYKLTGLRKNTLFYFQIEARSVESTSPSSEIVSIKTLMGPALPMVVPTQTGTFIGTDAMTIAFIPITEAEEYIYEYKKNSESSWMTGSVTAPATTAEITGLSSNTIYNFRIKGINETQGRESSWSDTVSNGLFANPLTRSILNASVERVSGGVKVTLTKVHDALSYVVKRYISNTPTWEDSNMHLETYLKEDVTEASATTITFTSAATAEIAYYLFASYRLYDIDILQSKYGVPNAVIVEAGESVQNVTSFITTLPAM